MVTKFVPHPVPPGDKPAGIDAILQTQGTTLEIVLLDAYDANQPNDATAADLNDRLYGTHLTVSRDAVRRWTNWYRDQPQAAA